MVSSDKQPVEMTPALSNFSVYDLLHLSNLVKYLGKVRNWTVEVAFEVKDLEAGKIAPGRCSLRCERAL